MTQSVLGTSMNRGPVSKPAAGLMHGPELPPDWKPAPKCSTNGCNEPVVYEGAPGSYKCQGCYDYMTEMYPTAAAQYTRIETAACDPIPPRPVPDPSEPMPEPAPAANLAHDLANAQMVIDFQQSEIEKLTAERNAVMAVLNPSNLPGLSLADAARWLGDDWKAEKERNDKLACQLAEWRAEAAKLNEENGKLLKISNQARQTAHDLREELKTLRTTNTNLLDLNAGQKQTIDKLTALIERSKTQAALDLVAPSLPGGTVDLPLTERAEPTLLEQAFKAVMPDVKFVETEAGEQTNAPEVEERQQEVNSPKA